MNTIDTAVLGATGYTGAELIRLLDGHPNFTIRYLGANAQAGRRLDEALPGLRGSLGARVLQTAHEIPEEGIDLVFTALPHTAAAQVVARALGQGARVVDLSADFRHQSAKTYQAAYQNEHPHPELLNEAIYGLSEWQASSIASARLVANPGCYPTSVLLPLIPLLRASLVDCSQALIVDAKSGTSGAGRAPKRETLYCEINEGVSAYGLPRHRHAWEMEEWAGALSDGQSLRVRFVPHILPMSRGMLSTLHLRGKNVARWLDVLREAYDNAPFVQVLPPGVLPSTKDVAGSNRCDIGLQMLGSSQDEWEDVVIVSCIDNLLKGAAGQAVQNANLMFGLPAETGLPLHAQWP